MHVIQIGAGADDVEKLLECAPTLGPAGSIGCQIPGNDNRSPRRLHWEDSATPQVSGLIDNRWRVTLEVRVSALCVFSSGTRRVADIAMTHPVNQVAAKSHEPPVLALQIQRHRSDLEAPANDGLLPVRFVVIGARQRDSTQGSHADHHGKRGCRWQIRGCRYQCDEYLLDVHVVSSLDSSRCDERTANARSDQAITLASCKAPQTARSDGLPCNTAHCRSLDCVQESLAPIRQMSWSALWTIPGPAKAVHCEASRRIGSTRGRKSRRT